MSDINIRPLAKKFNEDPLYSQFLNLRNDVLRIPIGLSLFDEDYTQKIDSIAFVAVNSQDKCEKVVGCIILVPYPGDPTTVKMRQMAVSPEYQGKGLGSKLVYTAEKFAKDQGKKRCYVHARKVAYKFYQKLGYQFVHQEEFLEGGIPHYAMEKVF